MTDAKVMPVIEAEADQFAEGFALRLEQRTELNRDYADYEAELSAQTDNDGELLRAVNVRDYGNGLVEVGYSSVQYIKPLRRTSSDSDTVADPETEQEKRKRAEINLSRSVRRSKAQARRKCMAGGLDHLLTLTYRENMTDEKTAYAHFKAFLRKVRERYPDWKYLAVHELQSRGAIHFHCAVKGYQDVRYLRSCWLSVVGAGNIDVKAPQGRGAAKWKLPRLASYLTKYITKNATTANARQRYRVAEGIEIPESVSVLRFPKWTDFVAEIFDSLGVTCKHHWKPDRGQFGWACSWT